MTGKVAFVTKYNLFKLPFSARGGFPSIGGLQMRHEELERWLWNYDQLEMTSITHGIKDIEQILLLIHNELPMSQDSQILSADILIKSTEKLTFIKHPRCVEIKPHKHSFLELTYVYAGSCTQVINGKALAMKEGDIVILDTDVVHEIPAVDENTIIINVLFRKDYFNQSILARLAENDLLSEFVIDAIYKPTMQGRYLYFPSHGNDKARQYITAAMCEHLDPDIGSLEAVNCFIVLMFTELLRASKHNPVNHTGSTRTSVVDILQYVEEHYESTTLVEIAEHFHFHPNYLSRLLKNNFNKTYSQMILELRLRKARLLLENTDFQVRSIAEECGYSNFNHFYRKFKEQYNVTPADYRKQHKKAESP